MDILKEKIKGLEKFTGADDLNYMEEEIAELLERSPDKEKYIPDILKLMEKNPLADWGLPGALVHFMESCDITVYEKFLKESITRCPTEHTLFMFNRICNVKTLTELTEYTDILYDIMKNTSFPADVRNYAEDFLEYQLGKLFI